MNTYEHDEIIVKRPKATNLVSRSFWMGFAIHALITLMVQDWHGLIEYKRLLDDHWVDIYWAVWLIPIFIVTVLYYRTQKQCDNV